MGVTDPSGPQAHRVYTLLREALLAGEFPSGTRLPSQERLAYRFGVATLTLRRALAVLEQEGFVISRHGRGTFVLGQMPQPRETENDTGASTDLRFHMQFQNFPIPTFTWRAGAGDWILIDTNRAADELNHGVIRTLIGQRARTLYVNHPEVLDEFERCSTQWQSIRRAMCLDLVSSGEQRDLIMTFVFIQPDLVMLHAEDETERILAERTRLDALAEERVAARKADVLLLQNIATALFQPVTPTGVADAMVSHGFPLMGANGGSIRLLAEGGECLDYVGGSGYAPELLPSFQRVPLSVSNPFTDAVRERAALWIESPDEWQTLYPEDSALQVESGHEAAAIIPLVAKGDTLGVLSITFAAAQKFDDDTRRFLLSVTQHCAQALERARLYGTERRRAVELQALAERTIGLQALTAALSTAVTPQDVAQVVAKEGAHTVGAIGARVSILSEDGLTLRMLSMLGPQIEDIEHYRTVSLQEDVPFAEVAQTGQPVWLSSAAQWQGRYTNSVETFTRAGYRAGAFLPISTFEKVLGALSFGFGQEREFGDDDRAFLLSIARQSAQAMERALLYESVQQSEARFRAQFLGFPIPTYVWQVRGDDLDLIDSNFAGDAITHGHVRAVMGAHSRVMYAEQPEILDDFALCLRERQTIRREMRHRFAPAGTEHDFVVHYVFVPPDLVMVHTEDVTDRVQAEKHLRFQAHLLDTVGQSVIAATPDGEITYWNRGAESFFLYSGSEAVGRNIVDVFATASSTEESRSVIRAITAGQRRVDDIVIRRRDGSMAPVLIHTTPVYGDAGAVTGVITVSSDISQLREAEEARRGSEELFRAMFEQVAVGVVKSDLDGNMVLVNDYFVTLLGYTRDELLHKKYQEITHPDDVDANLTQHRLLTTGAISSYRLEKRYIRKDGTSLWGHLTVTLMHDGLGKPEHTLTVIADIDARKHAEQALTASEYRYRGLVETSPDGILLTDMDGVILTANRQLALMLGYDSPNDPRGMNIGMHLPEDDRQPTAEILEQRAKGKLSSSINTRYAVRRRDGRTFPADITSFVVPGAPGEAGFITSTVRDVTDRVAYETQLQHLALHDPLTGLANRTLFDDRLGQTLAAARRNHESLAVLLLDLDHFKEINDTFGHQVGDQVLREVGSRLTAVLRESDTLARMGGDEYLILLPDTDLVGAIHTATRLSFALEQPLDFDDLRFHVGTSIGIALFPDHADAAETILRHADVAMYSAKQDNSGYAVYAVENDSYSPLRLALSDELRDAIKNDQLVLHYQPKMRLATGEIDGMEALVRWNHPEHGLILPDAFIPLAEHSGLIRSLTTWVIDKALTQCREWRDLGFTVGVAVNLSARCLNDPDLPGIVMGSLAARGVPPSQLTVEITESVLIADPEKAMDMLGQFTDIGISLSIDDFGTGYSSLAYLRHLHAHELKIDKSFVIGLDTNDDNGFIVRSVIELGHNLGLEVVAEGVENQTTRDILSALTCDRIQGYHLARPQSGPSITRWLQERKKLRGRSGTRVPRTSGCLRGPPGESS